MLDVRALLCYTCSMANFKEKDCTVCGVTFTPASGMAKVCGVVCRKAKDAAYKATPEAKAKAAAYNASPKARAARDAYEATSEARAVQAAYRASPEGKAARAVYRASPEGKAAQAAYNASPEGKAAQAAYHASPEARAKRAVYVASTEGKAALRAGRHLRRDRVGFVVPQRWVKRGDVCEAACYWCGVEGVPMQHDHLMPVALGGPGVASNLHNACVSCNQAKRAKHPLVWIASLFE